MIAFCVLFAVFIGVFWWRTGVLAERLYDREKAMDKHLKAISREAQVALAEASRLRAEAVAAHQSANALLSDPRIRRLLNKS